jgi:sugar phosphate isomerase/epimerase
MLGLQLYTVRKKIHDAASAEEVLLEAKEMGYQCIQLAGSMWIIELAATAAVKVGIAVSGILVNMETCENEGDKLFDIARRCGATDIGISSGILTEAAAYDIASRANAFAKRARAEGFTFSYHNHSNEFIRGESGKTLMQLLVENFDPNLVDFMPDTYWLQHGGVDVRDFLENIKGRAKILHLKDMKRTLEGPTYAEIGVGNLNFKGIVETAKKVGIEHFIVEQDECDGDPLDSARISCEFLRKIL